MNHPDTKAESSTTKRQHVLTLPLLLALGYLIYEFTAQPGLAAMAMCLKFGWEDFRTARWLQLSDPDRARGRACYWLYLSSGLWKVAITGLGMILFIASLVAVVQPQVAQAQAKQLLPMIAGAGVTLVFGFGLSALTCFAAMSIASRNGIRLWLNGSVYLARVRREWPPLYGMSNNVLVVAVTAIIVTCMLIIPLTLGIGIVALDDLVNQHVQRIIVGVGSVFSMLILLPLFAIRLRELRLRGFFADHPADCWGWDPSAEETGDIGTERRYNEG